MITSNELQKVYETILKSPGMTDSVKVSIKVSRRNVLLLCQLIENGLTSKESKNFLPNGAEEELKLFRDEFLSKGEFSEEFISSFKDLTTTSKQTT